MAFDFAAAVTAPFRMRPGLRRLDAEARHLTPNAPGDRALREKLAVLSRFADEALVAVEGFDARPALEALSARAAREHPRAWVRDGEATVHAPHLGWSLVGDDLRGAGPPEIRACLRALPPCWRLAGLLALAFAQDFAVIEGDGARIPWIAACLPSNWSPEEKVGRGFAQVHAPVADNAALLASAEALAELVTAGEAWERFVWSLTDDSRLHRHPRRAPPVRWSAALDPDALAATAYFRSERQTFLPVPDRRQAVFTIEVDVRPLADAVASAQDAARLHAALASMSPAVLAYRHLDVARDRLLSWLDTRARRGA